MEGRGEAVYSQQGEPVRLYGVGIDITDRKRAEEKSDFLASLDRALQEISDPDDAMKTASRLICEHLDADRCAYAEIEDEKVFVITGDYPRGVPSIVGRWDVGSFGPECTRAMLDNVPFVVFDTDADSRIGQEELPAYRATTIRSVICVPLHKNGVFTAAMAVHQKHSRVWTEDEIQLVQLAVNRCWESLERSRAARSLRESDERMRAMFESTTVGVAVLDTHSCFIQVNDAFAQITGRSHEELAGACWIDLTHPDDADELKQNIDAIIESA
jgi:GAF domain-containing protein